MSLIYLDNAATTHTHPEVIKEMNSILCDFYGNPSSLHSVGRSAKAKLEHSRKKICEYLKVEDNVTSPTFSIVNNYTYANNHTISHFDFYRLESIDEVYNIGVYEYLDSSKFCFFEWPEVANEIFTDKYLKIFIKVNNSKRIINIVS